MYDRGVLPLSRSVMFHFLLFGANGTNNETAEGDRLELQVTDNGAGLADVTKALLLFSSTKSGHGLEQG